MRGRKPAPLALLKARGRPSARPAEMEPEVARPKCPSHLSAEAKREWRRVVAELEAAKVLAKVDAAGLAAYCQTFARWAEAERELAKGGTIVRTPKGHLVQSPWLSIANRAMLIMHKFLVEFGLTPVSRARVRPAEGRAKRRPASDGDAVPALRIAQ